MCDISDIYTHSTIYNIKAEWKENRKKSHINIVIYFYVGTFFFDFWSIYLSIAGLLPAMRLLLLLILYFIFKKRNLIELRVRWEKKLEKREREHKKRDLVILKWEKE